MEQIYFDFYKESIPTVVSWECKYSDREVELEETVSDQSFSLETKED